MLMDTVLEPPGTVYRVKYMDDEGEDVATFSSKKEMNQWISCQESFAEFGDKFVVLSVE